MDWIILIVFAILLYWIDRAYFQYLIKKNLCVQCKYDLSYSPESCPECGMPKPNEQIRCHTTN